MKTTEAAKGKWKQLLPMFGIEERFLDGKHHACPCDGKGKDRFRFSDQNGTGAFFCGCSQGEKGGFGLLECKTGRPFRELAADVDGMLGNIHDGKKRERTYAERLRDVATVTKRSAYLASRGLEVAPGLLWARAVEYREDGAVTGKFAAMLAPIHRKGEFLTFHVTYLSAGRKAAVPCPRKILPGPPIAGAGVELYPAAEEMGVAEGIETAIAARMLFGIPTHSALNADMLSKWEPPKVAKRVHIFADRDSNFAGHRGAYGLAHRLALKGIAVEVRFPETIGDFNDVLLAQRRAA